MELALLKPPPPDLIEKLKNRYEIDFRWRAAWGIFAHKKESCGRLQSKQEYIERRAKIADTRIAALMIQYDAACSD